MSSEKQIHPAPAEPPAADTKPESKEEHIDRVDTTAGDADEKPIQDETRDHTGAHRKTDPEEIRLVRKLDYRIMVSRRNLCYIPSTIKEWLANVWPAIFSPHSASVCKNPI